MKCILSQICLPPLEEVLGFWMLLTLQYQKVCVRQSFHADKASWQSTGPMQNISCFDFIIAALQTIASLQPPTLQPVSGILIAYSPFSTLAWTFTLSRRNGRCTAAPIDYGENGPCLCPENRGGVWWAPQGQRGPERVQENMQNRALKRQRFSFSSPLL